MIFFPFLTKFGILSSDLMGLGVNSSLDVAEMKILRYMCRFIKVDIIRGSIEMVLTVDKMRKEE